MTATLTTEPTLESTADVRQILSPGQPLGRIRVGLLGAGAISEFHVRGLERIEGTDIIGIADIDAARASDAARRFGLPASFSSLTDLLETRPDVLHVLTPPADHAESAIQALQAGCHVYVEKPLATSTADCDRIAAAAEEAGRTVCTGHSLLYDPFIVKARGLVRSGAIGDVVAVDHFRSQTYPPYAGGPIPYQYRDGGFPFRDLGVHSLYLIESFLGAIEKASLELGEPSRDGCPLFKEWRVLVRCGRGLGHIYYSWNVMPPQDMLLIHGERGVIRCDMMGMSVTMRKKSRLPGAALRILNPLNEGRSTMMQVVGNVFRVVGRKLRRYHGLQAMLAEFYQALREKTPPPVTVERARPIVHWTERIASQADEAKRRYVAGFPTRGTADVLVTGATGFIGRRLLERLLEEYPRVRILGRGMPSDPLFRHDRIEFFLGNLGHAADVDRAVEGVSTVYHLGATVNGWAEDFCAATTLGTQHVVESCLKHGVAKLVYMSSLSVIHMAAAGRKDRITETWPLEKHPEARGLYSQTKLAAEQVVAEAVANRGLRAIILRPGEVVGADRPFLSGAVAIEAGSRLLVLGNGRQTLPLIWMDDLIDATLAAARSDHFRGTVLHLVDPDPPTQDEIARYYLAAKHGPGAKAISHLPLAFLYAASAAADLLFRLLGRNAPLTPYRLRSAIGKRTFDCSAAAEAIGWTPRVGVRRGLQAMTESVNPPCM
jgi:2-alkyl-3-oxoalkanoate reductase